MPPSSSWCLCQTDYLGGMWQLIASAYPDVSQYEMHTKAELIDDELIDAVIVFVDITERITVKAHQYYY